jgi:hypothetical protein
MPKSEEKTISNTDEKEALELISGNIPGWGQSGFLEGPFDSSDIFFLRSRELEQQNQQGLQSQREAEELKKFQLKSLQRKTEKNILQMQAKRPQTHAPTVGNVKVKRRKTDTEICDVDQTKSSSRIEDISNTASELLPVPKKSALSELMQLYDDDSN